MTKAFFGSLAVWNFFVWAMISSLHAESESLFLGEDIIPSSIYYSDLAQTIDRRFKNLVDVEVVSLKIPLMQRYKNWADGKSHIHGIELRFRAKVRGEGTLYYSFVCKMKAFVSKWMKVYLLTVAKCKNPEGFIVRYFWIREDIIKSFDRRRFIN